VLYCAWRAKSNKKPRRTSEDEATGPEQRRGLSVSQAIGDDKNQAIAFHYEIENVVVSCGLEDTLAVQLVFL
jgi:hypothetical protein